MISASEMQMIYKKEFGIVVPLKTIKKWIEEIKKEEK